MGALQSQLVLANTQQTVGMVVAVLITLAFVAYGLINIRISRPEIGAEMELAPNRKPYLDDEELETRTLDRNLLFGLGLLLALGIGLPAYWLAEPGRQDGEVAHQEDQYYRRGERIYNEGAQCNACHGPLGAGGSTNFSITDADGNFVDAMVWQAPALDTVLYRYSREEVEQIVIYGRAGTPMPAWGIDGGGPLDANAIKDVVTYLEHNQKPVEAVREEIAASLEAICAPESVADGSYTDPVGDAPGQRQLIDPQCTNPDAEFATMGEALFNLPAVGGTYSCARCHTQFWSARSTLDEPPEATMTGSDGGGFFGPSLRSGATDKYSPAGHIEFVTRGGEFPGTWEMPGFGYNPNAEEEGSYLTPEQFTFTAAQIEAIVAYERSL